MARAQARHVPGAGACCPWLYRRSVAEAFIAKAKALGFEGDPAVEAALERITEHTHALEGFALRQQQGDTPRRWWADGEYDDSRADASNDHGTHCVPANPALCTNLTRGCACRHVLLGTK